MADNKEDILEDSFSSDAEFDEEEDESSTDVDAKLEEEDVFDVEFLKCYSALKKKDKKIYDKNVRFFQDQELSTDLEDDDSSVTDPAKQNKASVPKMTLLDHQMLLNEDNIEEPSIERIKVDLNQEVPKSFYEKELDEIKKSIEQVGQEIDSDTDDELLVVRGKPTDHQKQRTKDKLKTILDKIEDREDEDLLHLQKVWSDPNVLSEEDRFLRDYILNKRYLAKSDENDDADDEDDKAGYFSKNIDELSDAEDDTEKRERRKVAAHHSDEKDFETIVRIPRNSTKTIRDLVEKQEKKEKRLKKLEKEKKRKRALREADCEDVIHDLPTKFHYRETEPNDFGLTAEELLMATDEELDKWVNLKECIAYKSPEEELEQKRAFESKRDNIELKKKIFKSIYGDEQQGEAGDQVDRSGVGAQSTTGKKRSRGKKHKPANNTDSSFQDGARNSPAAKEHSNEGSERPTESNRQKKKRKKTRGLNQKKFAKVGVAPDRLLAYGLSKTKLKKSKIL